MGIASDTGLLSVQALTQPGDTLVQQYLDEYSEHLAAVRADLLSIARGLTKNESPSLLYRVFRAVHAVRGAGFFGLPRIAELARQMEDELALFCSRGTVLKPHQIRVLLMATDRLSELVRDSENSNEADVSAMIATLSRLHGDLSASRSEKRVGSGARNTNGAPSLRTLVGEDDFSCQLLIRTFFSRYGECDAVANGLEAVEVFREALGRGKRYDLLCLDVKMPEMDGPEALRQIRALEESNGIDSFRGAKIIMMTSVDDTREVIRCFEEFTDAYLMKPINLAGLLRQLRSWQLIPFLPQS